MLATIIQVTLMWLVHLYDELVEWHCRRFYYRHLRPHLDALVMVVAAIRHFGLVRPADALRLNRVDGSSKQLRHLALIIDSDEAEWRSFLKALQRFARLNRITQVSLYLYLPTAHLERIATVIDDARVFINNREIKSNREIIEKAINNSNREIKGKVTEESQLVINLYNEPQREHHERVLRDYASSTKAVAGDDVADDDVAGGDDAAGDDDDYDNVKRGPLTAESLSAILLSTPQRQEPIDLVISTQRRLSLDLLLPWTIGFAQFSWQPGAPLDAYLLRAASKEYIGSKQNFGR